MRNWEGLRVIRIDVRKTGGGGRARLKAVWTVTKGKNQGWFRRDLRLSVKTP